MPRRVRFLTWRTRTARKRLGIEKEKRRAKRNASLRSKQDRYSRR